MMEGRLGGCRGAGGGGRIKMSELQPVTSYMSN